MATAADLGAFSSSPADCDKSKGLTDELHKWRLKVREAMQRKAAAAQAAARAKKKQVDEEGDSPDEEQKAVDKARLEAVRKRRAEQEKQRIAKDGWDRMKPMSADNRPPGTAWPPPSEVS